MNICVLLPTIYRKEGLKRALDTLFETTKQHKIDVVVAREYDDYDALDVCKQYKLKVSSYICEKEKQGPAYAWNTALKHAQFYEAYFLASDDIEFLPDWLDEILKVYKMTGKGLIGVNDSTGKFERAGFCTHYFMTRSFIKDVNGGVVACPHYFADYTDVEIIDRARKVNEFAYAPNAKIIHLWRLAEDEAYKRADQRRYQAKEIYLVRKAKNFPNDYEAIIK